MRVRFMCFSERRRSEATPDAYRGVVHRGERGRVYDDAGLLRRRLGRRPEEIGRCASCQGPSANEGSDRDIAEGIDALRCAVQLDARWILWADEAALSSAHDRIVL